MNEELNKEEYDVIPLGDRIIIEPLEKEKVRESGLVIASTEDKRENHGVVITVGDGQRPDGKIVPPRVKPGDEVLYSKHAVIKVPIENSEQIFIKELDIIAILKRK